MTTIVVSKYLLRKFQAVFYTAYAPAYSFKDRRFDREQFEMVERPSLTIEKKIYSNCVPFISSLTDLSTSFLEFTGEIKDVRIFMELMTDVYYSDLFKHNKGAVSRQRS